MIVLLVIACVVLGYALGSFNGAILISRWFHKEDIRTRGSGNAGLTNFFRIYGGFETLLVLLIDVGKTILACFIGGWLMNTVHGSLPQTGSMICGAAAAIGHVFPLFFGFKGGKGILTCGALAAFMDWKAFVIVLTLFILTVAVTRYVSLGSVLAAVAYPFLFLWSFPENLVVIILAFVVAAMAVIMHRGNIVRLCKGTESKLTFRKKKQEPPKS